MILNEVWKDIVGYENYKVSNLGRVKSLDRYVKAGFGSTRHSKGKILKPEKIWSGYLRVNLYNNIKMNHYFVHRLVATAFIDNIDKKPQINHKDGNKQNNSVNNLEYVTASENTQHSYDNKLGNQGFKNKPVIMFNINKEPLLKFDSIKEASASIEISGSLIGRCCKGKNKTAGGYKWEYA